MRKTRVIPTPVQGATLEKLRTVLAEQGYLIFPVDEFFRQSDLDFIAMPKEWPRRFVRIRPIQSGKVMVQSFAARTQYQGLQRLLKSLKDLEAPVHWGGAQLPFSRARPDWWNLYIPEASRKELALLGLY